MTICNTLNVKLCNLQPNILKSEIKNDTEVTLNFSLKLIENEANDQVSRIHKALSNGSSAHTKSSKTKLSKMIQLGGSNPFYLVLNQHKAIHELTSKLQELANKVSHDGLGKPVKPADTFRKVMSKCNNLDLVIMLTNNEIKGVIKGIRSLENIRILLKRNTKKDSCQEGEFPNLLRLLISAGLPLMKYILTPLDKKSFVTIRINSSSVGDRYSYSGQNSLIGDE